MRVSLLTDTYLPEINGVTTVLATMRTGLAERGFDVQIVAPRYDSDGPDDEAMIRRPSVPFPGYPAARLSSPFGADVVEALRRASPDLIHVVTEGPIGMIGRRFALRREIPLVTSFHTDFPRYAARYLGRWAERPTRAYLRRFHGRARQVQTPSEATRSELAQLGIEQTVVWGRGVDSRLFTPERRSEARRAHLLGPARLLILHVGRLAVEKDVDTLVSAFGLARGRMGETAAFCVAGDGPRASAIKSALPFAQHLGFLDRITLADLYADADLFVFPSPTETCGLVALEAMAAGLPVLASDAGGVRENLRHGLNGLLLPRGNAAAFANAIVGLARETDQRDAMAAAARAFAVGRDWNRELDRLPTLYAEAMLASSVASPARSLLPDGPIT